MTVNITATEVDGSHYVDAVMDGHELERRGPFASADEAQAAAARLAAFCRGLLCQSVHIGAVRQPAERQHRA